MSLDKIKIGNRLLAELSTIISHPAEEKRLGQLYFFFNLVLEELTDTHNIVFNTLFARLAFLGIQEQLPPKTLYALHHFRKAKSQGNLDTIQKNSRFESGVYGLSQLIKFIYEIEIPDDILKLAKAPSFNKKAKQKDFIKASRGVVLEIDVTNKTLKYLSQEEGLIPIKVFYDLPQRNEIFTPGIERLQKLDLLPVDIQLLDIVVDEHDFWRPAAVIINPDFLVDVTAVAELYDAEGAELMHYLLKKFMPQNPSKGLLLGNIANFLLDELMTNPEIEIDALYARIFANYPLIFSVYDDNFVADIIGSARAQFDNLKRVIKEDLPNINVAPEHVFLEPSFYDHVHGLQGRLDILHLNEDNQQSDILELKSGSIYKPNVYGLNNNHYTQTLLYDLIVQSVFKKKYKAASYILYSKNTEKPLRFAPPVKSKQLEAMAIRNQIVLMEAALGDQDEQTKMLSYIRPSNYPQSKGFIKDHIRSFDQFYRPTDELNKSYFAHFVSFISKEQRRSKTGSHGVRHRNGLASLWLDSIEEKEQHFSILKNLVIEKNLSEEAEPIIHLKRTEQTNPLANFRKGDIVIFYPFTDATAKPTDNQVFKSTIIAMTEELISIRLRSRQTNQTLFKKYATWNIEGDTLDSSFNAMYRSLFSYLATDDRWKKRWMAQLPPANPEIKKNVNYDVLTKEQNQILNEMLSCKDYYLLWGPPGTGKTSRMIRTFVDHLYHHSDERLLLLAYTNRAVDEICEAIENIKDNFNENYLRIGSRYATGEKFRSRLLNHEISGLESRQKVKTLLLSKKIYVATLSSVINKPELFKLLSFDTVVIDEASQILEPMLAGFLNRFKRYLLIGDHKQIPAVVAQEASASKVSDPSLKEAGLIDLRNSFFERMYKKCQENNWDWAIGKLMAQGRMHEEIMEFPNAQFYRSELKIIPKVPRLNAALVWDRIDQDSLGAFVANHRTGFIDAAADQATNFKTNIYEAETVGRVVAALVKLYEINGKELINESIGVITPYRAQIAQILKVFYKLGLPNHLITVDTVERFQGGARDHIVISFCANQSHQLQSLMSLSSDGIDRKLNVALTRAKEQIILVGNKEILSQNPVYKELIHGYRSFMDSTT